ncbi:unnamed protein product [Clonostachys solani]|uniref:Zn(2)-C6 fungal-type domain-containing protein n=1 Tax=Clonostachys solani TaxID=160281 RepID=A0A9P0ERC5_9HYPO|nr:unnamed protein product [Clonostachys solani]
MTKGLGLRQYCACVRCRGRKIKCDLQSVGEPGRPPCAKCAREGAECVLAQSRRGGNYSHLRGSRQKAPNKPVQEPTAFTPSSDHFSPHQHKAGDHDSLQNPSDALLILAHAAGQPDEQIGGETAAIGATYLGGVLSSISQPTARAGRAARNTKQVATLSASNEPADSIVDQYGPIQDGSLDLATIATLVRHYADNYHQFLPICPVSTLRTENILHTIEHEPFLLTAILVVASQSQPDFASVHESIWKHMKQLIMDVVLGAAGTRSVGCVEGLLLLGEWTMQDQTTGGGEGAAWSVLGLAVRTAYLLRLEDSSFKTPGEENDASLLRNRLAWTFTYLSDRQISIRMGQAFWCRGPALSTRFTAQDFPTLQAKQAGDEDFASLVQAQVELTTLFGNAHDILFASRSRTAELMMRGDYSKYVDDTARAMAAWQRVWGSISVSSHLTSCLSLTYEYLHLYVNAFAFQAVLYRTSVMRSSDRQTTTDASRASMMFPDSTMASPDARPIYEAIDAAEKMLKIVTEEINPEKHLRYMPARFYLYEIHSSVFLYKAHAVGAIPTEKFSEMTELMCRFVTTLKSAGMDEEHIASKFAKLLERLWFRRANTSTPGSHLQSGVVNERLNGTDISALMGSDLAGGQILQYDELILPEFDCADPIDTLFAMPPVFPMDQAGFFGYGT